MNSSQGSRGSSPGATNELAPAKLVLEVLRKVLTLPIDAVAPPLAVWAPTSGPHVTEPVARAE